MIYILNTEILNKKTTVALQNVFLFLALSISIFLNTITLFLTLKLLVLDLPNLLTLNFQELKDSINLLESRLKFLENRLELLENGLELLENGLKNMVKTPIAETTSPLIKKEDSILFNDYNEDPLQALIDVVGTAIGVFCYVCWVWYG